MEELDIRYDVPFQSAVLPAFTMPNFSLSQRMRKLQTRLLAIRLGSGALVLPKEVKRIHMRFAVNWNDGHLGPRYIIEPTNKLL